MNTSPTMGGVTTASDWEISVDEPDGRNIELPLAERIRDAAIAAGRIGASGGVYFNIHSITLEQGAELLAAGYYPQLNTNRHSGGPNLTTYFALSANVEGVGVTVFTVHRAATPAEIEAVEPRPVLVALVTPSVAVTPPAQTFIDGGSRWSQVEID